MPPHCQRRHLLVNCPRSSSQQSKIFFREGIPYVPANHLSPGFKIIFSVIWKNFGGRCYPGFFQANLLALTNGASLGISMRQIRPSLPLANYILSRTRDFMWTGANGLRVGSWRKGMDWLLTIVSNEHFKVINVVKVRGKTFKVIPGRSSSG